MNAGTVKIGNRWINLGRAGQADIVAYIPHYGIMWVYFIELKRSDGGNWHENQREFASRLGGVKNIIYELVRDPKQIDKTIELITGYQERKLQEIKFMED